MQGQRKGGLVEERKEGRIGGGKKGRKMKEKMNGIGKRKGKGKRKKNDKCGK